MSDPVETAPDDIQSHARVTSYQCRDRFDEQPIQRCRDTPILNTPPWGSPPSPDGATHEVLSLVTEPRRPLDEPPPVFGQYDAAGRAIKDCVSKLTLQIGNALGYR